MLQEARDAGEAEFDHLEAGLASSAVLPAARRDVPRTDGFAVGMRDRWPGPVLRLWTDDQISLSAGMYSQVDERL